MVCQEEDNNAGAGRHLSLAPSSLALKIWKIKQGLLQHGRGGLQGSAKGAQKHKCCPSAAISSRAALTSLPPPRGKTFPDFTTWLAILPSIYWFYKTIFFYFQSLLSSRAFSFYHNRRRRGIFLNPGWFPFLMDVIWAGWKGEIFVCWNSHSPFPKGQLAQSKWAVT